MKLALVVPGGVDRSGEFRVIPVLLALIGRLARAHDVHVFALRQEAAAGRWQLAGATVHNIGDGWTRLRAIAAIRAEHRRAPFDVIQAIFSGSCSLVAVAAAKWLRRPSLVHVAGGELVTLYAIGYGGRRKWKGRLREAVVLRGADVITAASAPIIDSLQTLGLKARRVPLGVDLRTWPPLAPRERSAKQARLIHVASLNRVKDQSTLLQALAVLAEAGLDFRMDIVGEDTLQGEMQQLARRLGLEQHVRFHGFKTQRELRPLMESADLLVMSSLHEAGPLVALEAAAAGVPTVGTAVGHIAEWAPSAALAVPIGEAPALADAIRRLLGDEELRLRLAATAQCRAIREDADHTALAFEAIYLRLLAACE
ncbi:hexosyltransferase [Rhodanobacter sp. FW510-R12]|uniref:glycosyltransferase family 4 protein n=1 Tax=unclassified Rhodanobacter TaxID=2621553 RepID=UPI0007AA1470|nr:MULTISPECIES: glycosyltransferase family 4 protein [unclassified Rhodanobacter]KZC16611.1 hexosyltransferase [Rhodanobacter sp. FW104-R8]KZC27528.1 hexosyltransferase [Rhodanobacter sp. FW510-T8]KZC31831.1 hexosyltransferase [Rhodanobacter sp. FW510-R10]